MNDPAGTIDYMEGGVELLDQVVPLWEELNRHHQKLSEHFSDAMAARAFADRRSELVEKSNHGRLRVDVARTGAGDFVAYCIATVDPTGTGEIDSIFVQPALRNRGIGDALMRRAMAWMDALGTHSRVLNVAWGNDRVGAFYQRYGFLPRSTTFEKHRSFRRVCNETHFAPFSVSRSWKSVQNALSRSYFSMGILARKSSSSSR